MPRHRTPAPGLALVALVAAFLFALTARGDGTKPPDGSAKPQTTGKDKPKEKPTLDDAVKNAGKVGDAAEGSTASAIRGLTATTSPSGPTAHVTDLQIKGLVSPDSENKNKESDPPFVPHKLASPGPAKVDISAVLPPGRMYLKDMPNAQAIVDKSAALLSKKQIHVALLAQHKYMINDCLGMKVSAGEFTLQMANPSAKIVDEGIQAEFKIDKISFNAFSLRFRPDPTDLIEPCHFSGRVEVGGEASNVVIQLRYNPVIDIEKCRVGQPGHLVMHVDIGNINLKPIPNDVDKVCRGMIEDAINYACYLQTATSQDEIPMLLSQITQTIDDVLEVDCKMKDGTAGSVKAKVAGTGSPVSVSATAPAEPVEKALPYTITPIPNAAGRMGRIALTVPAQAGDTRFFVCKPGDDEKHPTEAGFGSFSKQFLPGRFDVYVNHKRVGNVPVESGKMTTIVVGEIKTSADGQTHCLLYDAEGKTQVTAWFGAHVVALPVGSYVLKIGGTSTPITVKANEVTEY